MFCTRLNKTASSTSMCGHRSIVQILLCFEGHRLGRRKTVSIEIAMISRGHGYDLGREHDRDADAKILTGVFFDGYVKCPADFKLPWAQITNCTLGCFDVSFELWSSLLDRCPNLTLLSCSFPSTTPPPIRPDQTIIHRNLSILIIMSRLVAPWNEGAVVTFFSLLSLPNLRRFQVTKDCPHGWGSALCDAFESLVRRSRGSFKDLHLNGDADHNLLLEKSASHLVSLTHLNLRARAPPLGNNFLYDVFLKTLAQPSNTTRLLPSLQCLHISHPDTLSMPSRIKAVVDLITSRGLGTSPVLRKVGITCKAGSDDCVALFNLAMLRFQGFDVSVRGWREEGGHYTSTELLTRPHVV